MQLTPFQQQWSAVGCVEAQSCAQLLASEGLRLKSEARALELRVTGETSR